MNFNLDIPKMGYIILVKYDREKKKSFFSERIYRKQRKFFSEEDSLYTHAEISGGGADSVCITFPKSKAIKINEYYKGRYIKILRPCADLEEYSTFSGKQRYKIAYFYARLCNLAYDCKGVISFLFTWVRHSNRLFFCSEGVTWAYQKIYKYFLGGKDPSKVMPAELSAYKKLEVWWEGIV